LLIMEFYCQASAAKILSRFNVRATQAKKRLAVPGWHPIAGDGSRFLHLKSRTSIGSLCLRFAFGDPKLVH
jgi:hypothetical protein